MSVNMVKLMNGVGLFPDFPSICAVNHWERNVKKSKYVSPFISDNISFVYVEAMLLDA